MVSFLRFYVLSLEFKKKNKIYIHFTSKPQAELVEIGGGNTCLDWHLSANPRARESTCSGERVQHIPAPNPPPTLTFQTVVKTHLNPPSQNFPQNMNVESSKPLNAFFHSTKRLFRADVFELNENDPSLQLSGLSDQDFDRFNLLSLQDRTKDLKDWLKPIPFVEAANCCEEGCGRVLGLVNGRIPCMHCGVPFCSLHRYVQPTDISTLDRLMIDTR